MKLLVLAAAGALLLVADAACPNQCSGHGSCIQNDKCSCYAMWTGADCSQRTCPYGNAWAANSADPHTYAECANQGVCDRSTGLCTCFAGFEGYNCGRLACPNGCSGNGKCVPIAEAPTAIPYNSSNWDSSRILTCLCDAGYYGPDCSLRHCPTGDDPLTLCNNNNRNQVQEVRFTLGSQVAHDATTSTNGAYTSSVELMDLFGTSSTRLFNSIRSTTGQMSIMYNDAWGAPYITSAISGILDTTAAISARDNMEIALETLPDQKVLNVQVQTAMTKSGDANNGGIDGVLQRRWLVTFVADNVNSNNVGLQNSLLCPSAYSCTTPGCQPMVSMPFLYRYAGTKQDTPVSTTISSIGTGAGNRIDFFTGAANVDADAQAANFIRLNPASQPQMPPGVPIDTGVTASSLARYDMRILVAVIDPLDGIDSQVDVFYTRVIVGHQNITSNNERVGSTTKGPWTAAGGATFTTTLDGFTFNGPIPLKADGSSVGDKVPVPGAPGVYLNFDSAMGRNYVRTDGYGRWYEILVKLPNCAVAPVTLPNQVKAFGASTYITPVDLNVENIECSGRGSCDTSAGLCKCYTGYYGVACQSQTVLV